MADLSAHPERYMGRIHAHALMVDGAEFSTREISGPLVWVLRTCAPAHFQRCAAFQLHGNLTARRNGTCEASRPGLSVNLPPQATVPLVEIRPPNPHFFARAAGSA